ncbi:MAG: acetate kinase [Prevotellaceae bacterium]|jgi:acetate kinase|nr:acetate kinase [Prevotellaceae bacterium]
MIILVLNCGSSSIKYQLLNMKSESDNALMAKGIVERIGLPQGLLSHKPAGKNKYEVERPFKNHTEGINALLEALVSKNHGVINDVDEINAVGHRVAHGGEYFTNSSLVDSQVKKEIEKCFELAPLHNPANLLGIEAMERLLPGIRQVAVFDTSFHQTMPEQAYFYALPYEYYEKYRIRRYGFHGTSHQYVARKACRMTGLDFNTAKLITCHMGNGSSVAAINCGKSVDTSMGFTPLEGLMMGTRSGDIDAGVVTFIQEKESMDAKSVNNFLNKNSGLWGISGVSSDMRDLWKESENGNKRAQLALDMFIYRALKYVGAYAAAMNGVDAIVFTGGIGENDCNVRKQISLNLAYMGAELDVEANDKERNDKIISTPESKIKLLIASTNEELVIATDTMHIVSNL